MNVIEAMQRRRATRFFEQEGLYLPREAIEDLISDACLAPSEWNLQPWRFLVVRDQERKEVLYQCSYRQEKIREAAAVIVVCGDLHGYETAEAVIADQVAKGIIRPEDAAAMVASIVDRYQRSEHARWLLATRNASFVAMAMMMLATERGIASCPMGGFDDGSLRDAFHVPDRYLPIVLVALGMPSTAAERRQPPRGARLTVRDIVFHEDMAGGFGTGL